jgi:hypothetical protein
MIQGKIVMAGDAVFASIDEKEEPLSEVNWAMVVRFKNKDEFARALGEGMIRIDWDYDD